MCGAWEQGSVCQRGRERERERKMCIVLNESEDGEMVEERYVKTERVKNLSAGILHTQDEKTSIY